jgi:hypothetical protein
MVATESEYLKEARFRRLELRERTCWILGAGASLDCYGTGDPCLPLTRNLLDDSMVVGELFEKLRPLQKLGLDEPLDRLGAQLETTIDKIRHLCESPNRQTSEVASSALRAVTNAIAKRLIVDQLKVFVDPDKTSRSKYAHYSARNYLWLASGCCTFPNWAVITLNWDRLLDWAFETLAEMSNLPRSAQYSNWQEYLERLSHAEGIMPSQDASAYVKLHGSLDLFSCHNHACGGYRKPFAPKQGLKGLGFAYSITPHSYAECQVCGEPAVELVLPPGKNKTKGEGEYHEHVYALSERLLSQSDNWVVVGYSFPEYDEDVSSLLVKAITRPPLTGAYRNIWVIAPDCQSVCRRLAEKIGLTGERVMERNDLGTKELILQGLPLTFSAFVKAVQPLRRED